MENKLLKYINNNSLVLMSWSGLIGLLFYWLCLYAKHRLWSQRTLDIPSYVDINSAFQIGIFSIAVNFVVAFTSALLPAIACGLLFGITVCKSPIMNSLIAATVYVLLIYYRWLIGSYSIFSSDINVIISYTLSPLVAASVFVAVTMNIQSVVSKREHRKHEGSAEPSM